MNTDTAESLKPRDGESAFFLVRIEEEMAPVERELDALFARGAVVRAGESDGRRLLERRCRGG